MFKAYFLMKAGGDPFRYRGAKALDAIRAAFPDIRGYVQTRPLDGVESVMFSGTAELWFDDAAAAVAACKTGFNDLMTPAAELHSSLAGMERVVVRTPAYLFADRVKGVYPFCRKDGMDIASFQQHWWHNHGPIAALTEQALSYVQIHPVPGSYDLASQFYDGITEITWPGIEALQGALDSRQMKEDQGSDAPRFVNMESIALFIAKEETVLAP